MTNFSWYRRFQWLGIVIATVTAVFLAARYYGDGEGSSGKKFLFDGGLGAWANKVSAWTAKELQSAPLWRWVPGRGDRICLLPDWAFVWWKAEKPGRTALSCPARHSLPCRSKSASCMLLVVPAAEVRATARPELLLCPSKWLGKRSTPRDTATRSLGPWAALPRTASRSGVLPPVFRAADDRDSRKWTSPGIGLPRAATSQARRSEGSAVGLLRLDCVCPLWWAYLVLKLLEVVVSAVVTKGAVMIAESLELFIWLCFSATSAGQLSTETCSAAGCMTEALWDWAFWLANTLTLAIETETAALRAAKESRNSATSSSWARSRRPCLHKYCRWDRTERRC